MRLADYIFYFFTFSGIIFWTIVGLKIAFYYYDNVIDKIERK